MPPANAPPPSLVRWGARKVHWRLTILLLSGLPNWNAKRNRRARSTWPFLIDTSKHERSGDWNAAIPMSLDARGCQACRSEARRGGEGCVRTCRSRGSPYYEKQTYNTCDLLSSIQTALTNYDKNNDYT